MSGTTPPAAINKDAQFHTHQVLRPAASRLEEEKGEWNQVQM